MFWGCFSYDKKGPCHIWDDETPAEKKEAKEWLEQRNQELEEICRQEWELETAMRRLNVRRKVGGIKPKWRWTEKTGKLERKALRGGIDWYRYYRTILEKKLLPFAKECLIDRPNTIVQEDNAAPHAHKHQSRVYNLWQIIKLIWPSNSPDLNAIEKLWFWMKRQTTKHSAATSEKQLRKDWLACWESIPQKKIQEWIEAIPIHIQKIIELDGGNEYREGRGKNPNRVH